MRAARDKADAATAHAIERVEEEVVALLGDDMLSGPPDLGGGFRGYRVGDGSIYAPLPPRAPKLAVAASGLLVVATCFGSTYHVQRAPHSMRQARILSAYIETMTAALERHVEAARGRASRFDGIAERAGRLAAALSRA